ncbi:MAG: hypothetical protein Kow0049_35440 [Stanieria sp.]
MEELEKLRNSILRGEYNQALSIVDELEEMSRKDIIRKIEAYLVRLLAHLIKNQLEQRLTNSWIASIRDSIRQIKKLNQMNKSAYYIKQDDWNLYLEEAFEAAIDEAAIEVFGGTLKPSIILARVDREKILEITTELINFTYEDSTFDRVKELLQTLPGGEML